MSEANAQPPVDAHLRETTETTETVYQGKFLQMNRDVVRLPDGRTASREYVVHPGAVMVVAVLPDGKLVMERQFRYPVRQTMIEFPAGKLDAGEGGLACAQHDDSARACPPGPHLGPSQLPGPVWMNAVKLRDGGSQRSGSGLCIHQPG